MELRKFVASGSERRALVLEQGQRREAAGPRRHLSGASVAKRPPGALSVGVGVGGWEKAEGFETPFHQNLGNLVLGPDIH